MARAIPATSFEGTPRKSADDEAAVRRERRRYRRETIESFVVVVVGFLVWSIEAEGFMIPTGSMAPTLMGRHKEIVCPECGWTYRVNADCEVDPSGAGGRTGLRVTWGVCENCRRPAKVDDRPSFAGDRIYTLKTDAAVPFFPGLGRVEPRRWDVTVFRLPEDPSVRYIKRLVGMPGEVLRVQHGDLWRSDVEEGPFEILRRPPAQSLQVNIPVYDDAYRSRTTAPDPRWRRWVGWDEPAPGSYRASATAEDWRELRYRHLVPSPEQWEALADGRPPETPPRPTLITDFCSFDTDLAPQNLQQVRLATRPWFQPHWVGDLALSLRLEATRPSGVIRIELIEAGVSNRCEIDLATGMAQLFRDAAPLGPPAETAVKGAGAHELTFANIDDRLTLWVDGARPFGDGLPYDGGEPDSARGPTAEDLEPARVAVRGGDVSVGRLVLKRDVYYTQDPGDPDSDELASYRLRPPAELFDLLADPGRYAKLSWRRPREYPIAEGRYMMLGDNSSWSRDGRAWTRADQTTPTAPDRGWDDSGRESWEVPRPLILGRAFSVYWPHLRPMWPNLRFGPDVILPARPNVEAVRWIY